MIRPPSPVDPHLSVASDRFGARKSGAGLLMPLVSDRGLRSAPGVWRIHLASDSQQQRVNSVEGLCNIECRRVAHQHGTEAVVLVQTHHAVKASTAALLEVIAMPGQMTEMPCKSHRDRVQQGALL